MLHFVGYVSLLMVEAIGVGASASAHSGNEVLLAVAAGVLALVPTANHFAGWIFSRLTTGLHE